jgi:hypothetical protein
MENEGIKARMAWSEGLVATISVESQRQEPFAYVLGVESCLSRKSGLRGRFWFSCFSGRQSLSTFAIAPLWGALDAEQTCRPSLPPARMSFDL